MQPDNQEKPQPRRTKTAIRIGRVKKSGDQSRVEHNDRHEPIAEAEDILFAAEETADE